LEKLGVMEENKILINGIKVNYKISGEGKPLVILHGWGGSSDSWLKIIKELEKDFKIICPDLPGFGKSETPKIPWNLKDYVKWVKEFTGNLNLEKFFLIGHSFGGRIAIKFSIAFPEKVQKLILCNSAGIKQNKNLKEKIIFLLALLGNAILSPKIFQRFKDKARNLFYRFLRNLDYAKANETMKETMKKIIQEDLLPDLSFLNVKTLIVWGERDNVLPLDHAFIFKSKIPDSEIKIFPEVFHSPHLENPEKLIQAIIQFFKA
jgi:pimeloyl-ACP methyl ester carboxylesterase